MHRNAQDVHDIIDISATFAGLVAPRHASVSDDGHGRKVRWGSHARDTSTVTRTMNERVRYSSSIAYY